MDNIWARPYPRCRKTTELGSVYLLYTVLRSAREADPGSVKYRFCTDLRAPLRRGMEHRNSQQPIITMTRRGRVSSSNKHRMPILRTCAYVLCAYVLVDTFVDLLCALDTCHVGLGPKICHVLFILDCNTNEFLWESCLSTRDERLHQQAAQHHSLIHMLDAAGVVQLGRKEARQNKAETGTKRG